MKYRTGLLTVLFLVFFSLPCSLFAQGGGGTKPPDCCPEPEPPPPPPGGDSIILAVPTDSIAQITISDAELKELGITRSQLLDLLAATAFGLRADQSYSLVIPMYSPILTDEGTTAVRVTYLTIEAEKVAPEVLDTLSLVFITDGQTTVAILFTQSSGAE